MGSSFLIFLKAYDLLKGQPEEKLMQYLNLFVLMLFVSIGLLKANDSYTQSRNRPMDSSEPGSKQSSRT